MTTFTITAAHSGRIIAQRQSAHQVFALLLRANPLSAKSDMALIRTLGPRESVEVARRAYRVVAS